MRAAPQDGQYIASDGNGLPQATQFEPACNGRPGSSARRIDWLKSSNNAGQNRQAISTSKGIFQTLVRPLRHFRTMYAARIIHPIAAPTKMKNTVPVPLSLAESANMNSRYG